MACARSCMLGSWPVLDAVEKSVESWLSWLAALVLPLACAVCAASCKLVAICAVTCWYFVGSVCCNCCSVLNTRASGES